MSALLAFTGFVAILIAVLVARQAGSALQHRVLIIGAFASIVANILLVRFEPWTELAIIAFFLCLSFVMQVSRIIEITRWRRAHGDTFALRPPRIGSWEIVAGGPMLFKNHHASVPTQRFAYDLIRTDAASLGTPLYAPVDGVVEATRDDMPDNGEFSRGILPTRPPTAYGNFVAIRTVDATVVVCHLRRGSVCVKPGQQLDSEVQIGECGNSGNSTRPHIHLHAQRRRVDQGGDGIPIGFQSKDGTCVPLPGQTIS